MRERSRERKGRGQTGKPRAGERPAGWFLGRASSQGGEVSPGGSRFGSLGPSGTKGVKGLSSSPCLSRQVRRGTGPPSQPAVPEGAEQWLPVTRSNAGPVGPEHWLPAPAPHPQGLQPSPGQVGPKHWSPPRPAAMSAVSWVSVRRWSEQGRQEAVGRGTVPAGLGLGRSGFLARQQGQAPSPREGREGLKRTPWPRDREQRREDATEFCGNAAFLPPWATLASHPPPTCACPLVQSPFATGVAATEPGALHGAAASCREISGACVS